MKIDASLVVLWAGVVALMLFTWHKKGSAGVRAGFAGSWHLAKMVMQIIPFALLGAALFTQLIPAQIVAFLSGWSVYAFYRVMVWEVPTMGAQFTLHRMGASLILPIIAGVLTTAMLQWL
jgi:hypothetical protein